MSHQSDLIATDINAYLAQHERKELLRFLTCGNVDDGKSTLIGRLLYDSKMIYEDHLKAIEKDTVKYGTTGGQFDLALLTDGLKAEREQGITIDVAYRYFSTARRKFIIADCPGHVQYTRNMATGASTCDLAIILVDARPKFGVQEQTRRHSFITSLLGIKHILIAVNKMDLVGYSQDRFDEIRQSYMDFATRLDMPDLHFVPISALNGDNVVDHSQNMPWYEGSTLMHLLESVYIASDRNLEDFRLPVQIVLRPNLNFRGFAGTIASGILRRGDEIMALPSRRKSKVKSIVTFDGELEEAFAPQAVVVTLEDEIDISRGDVIVRPGNVPKIEQKFDATIVWMHDQPLTPGKPYLIKQSSKLVQGTISDVRYKIDVNTLHRTPIEQLGLNEIGRCTVQLAQSVAFDGYRRNRATGAFIVIDRVTNATVGAGMILDRSTEVKHLEHWDDEPASATLEERPSQVTIAERSKRFSQKPATILLTGLSGSGKSTIAYALERRLFDLGKAAAVLDGQNLRLGISKDLGFSSEDRSENLRRGIEVAKLMNEAGLICICSFAAPSEAVRQRAREVVGGERFLTVHVTAPLDVCRQRDTKGLYAKADSGEIANFVGVSAPYEPPVNPELVLDSAELPVEACVDRLMALLESKGVIA